MAIRYGSVCSGIEAATCAWHPLGWEAAWLAEIEPFPCAVLKHHYPTVPNLGDMTTIADRILAGDVEAPDVLTGGTPCQAFSVAGLRKGLDDARGQLTLAFCRLADAIDAVRLRGERAPAVIVWENVPGVLSDKGNAFGCFLAGLSGESDALVPPGGKWSNAGMVFGPTRTVAWRVLDAQYFGVAQRRRRVWVVASARADADPGAILFESDGVRRDSAPSREAGEGAAGCAQAGAYLGNAEGGSPDVPFMTASSQMRCVNNQTPLVACAMEDPFPPLMARSSRGGSQTLSPGHQTDGHMIATFQQSSMKGKGTIGYDKSDVAKPVKTQMDGQMIAFHPTQDPISSMDGTTHAMGCGSKGGVATIAIAQPLPFDTTQITSKANYSKPEPGDPCHPLAAGAHPPAVAIQGGSQQDQFIPPDGVSPTLAHSSCAHAGHHQPKLWNGMQVRRLTPVECERLQGFPDGYTAIPWRGKPADQCPDGPRYKALGNSWAVPCAAWIGRRIAAVLA